MTFKRDVEPVDEMEHGRMPLLDHLRELRRRLMRAAAAVVVGMACCIWFTDELLAFLTAPVRQTLGDLRDTNVDRLYLWLSSPVQPALEGVQVEGTLAITSSPLEGVMTYMMVGLIGGVVVASPVVAYEVWAFVAPGLYAKEKRVVVPLALASTLMFGVGCLFSYAIIFPLSFPFFLSVIDAEAVLSVDGYLQAVTRMTMAFGACFQLPVATWFLARIGLIDHYDMIKAFRYAVVVIFIVAAIITPPDVLTQILLGVPLCLLYVLGIGVAWASTTKVREPVSAAT
jgi:sec-independent protein translocase protein TatC